MLSTQPASSLDNEMRGTHGTIAGLLHSDVDARIQAAVTTAVHVAVNIHGTGGNGAQGTVRDHQRRRRRDHQGAVGAVPTIRERRKRRSNVVIAKNVDLRAGQHAQQARAPCLMHGLGSKIADMNDGVARGDGTTPAARQSSIMKRTGPERAAMNPDGRPVAQMQIGPQPRAFEVRIVETKDRNTPGDDHRKNGLHGIGSNQRPTGCIGQEELGASATRSAQESGNIRSRRRTRGR